MVKYHEISEFGLKLAFNWYLRILLLQFQFFLQKNPWLGNPLADDHSIDGRRVPSGKLTVGPWIDHPFLEETHLPTPIYIYISTRVELLIYWRVKETCHWIPCSTCESGKSSVAFSHQDSICPVGTRIGEWRRNRCHHLPGTMLVKP